MLDSFAWLKYSTHILSQLLISDSNLTWSRMHTGDLLRSNYAYRSRAQLLWCPHNIESRIQDMSCWRMAPSSNDQSVPRINSNVKTGEITACQFRSLSFPIFNSLLLTLWQQSYYCHIGFAFHNMVFNMNINIEGFVVRHTIRSGWEQSNEVLDGPILTT